ncbi:hypothetical protein B0H14DRAFT_3693517 [Mycena olivaceomarginata]|nr:hypothetical protein B0H14DRAFT_3693517 [Mycena olivaceomarginata]
MPSSINLAAVSPPGQRVNLIQGLLPPTTAPSRSLATAPRHFAPHWSSRPSDFVGPDAPYDAPSTGFFIRGVFVSPHPTRSLARLRVVPIALRASPLHLLRCLAPSHPSALPTLRLLRPLHPRPVPRFTPYLRCTRCASAASLPTLQCVRALHHAPRFDRAPASAPLPRRFASAPHFASRLALPHPHPSAHASPSSHAHASHRTPRFAQAPAPAPAPAPARTQAPRLHAFALYATPCFASRLPRFARTPPPRFATAKRAPAPRHLALHASPATPTPCFNLTLPRFARTPRRPRFAPPANALPPLACTPRLASPQCPAFALAHALSARPHLSLRPHPALRPCASPHSAPRFASAHALWPATRASPCPAHAHRFHPAPAPLPAPARCPSAACRPAPLARSSLTPGARASPPRLASPQRTHPRSPAPLPAPSHPAPRPSAPRVAPAPRVFALAPACPPQRPRPAPRLLPAPRFAPRTSLRPQRTHPRSPAPLPAPSAVHDRVPAHRTTAHPLARTFPPHGGRGPSSEGYCCAAQLPWLSQTGAEDGYGVGFVHTAAKQQRRCPQRWYELRVPYTFPPLQNAGPLRCGGNCPPPTRSAVPVAVQAPRRSPPACRPTPALEQGGGCVRQRNRTQASQSGARSPPLPHVPNSPISRAACGGGGERADPRCGWCLAARARADLVVAQAVRAHPPALIAPPAPRLPARLAAREPLISKMRARGFSMRMVGGIPAGREGGGDRGRTVFTRIAARAPDFETRAGTAGGNGGRDTWARRFGMQEG